MVENARPKSWLPRLQAYCPSGSHLPVCIPNFLNDESIWLSRGWTAIPRARSTPSFGWSATPTLGRRRLRGIGLASILLDISRSFVSSIELVFLCMHADGTYPRSSSLRVATWRTSLLVTTTRLYFYIFYMPPSLVKCDLVRTWFVALINSLYKP